MKNAPNNARQLTRLEHAGTKTDIKGAGKYNKKLTAEQSKQTVLGDLIPYTIANSGCTTACIKPLEQ